MSVSSQGDRTSRGTGRRLSPPVRFSTLALLAWLVVAATGVEPGLGQSRLQAQLDQILTDHDQPRIRLGAHVIELPGGRVLYDRNGKLPLVPASNMKLIVIAAAIDELGADYQFATVVAIRNTDLVVIGSGDPTIGDERLAKERAEWITAPLRAWADKLKEAGVKQIPGNIVIDDSIFDQQFVHPHWPPDQFQAWYEAPVGGLNFNSNCVCVRVVPAAPGSPAHVSLVPGNTCLQLVNKTITGRKNTAAVNRLRDSDRIVVTGRVAKQAVLGPVTVRDPGLYFGSVLKTVLAADGIRVGGQVVRERVRLRSGRIPDDCHIVAVHRAPLSDALSRAGKNSLGMAAEALIKLLGSRRHGAGTWENGRRALNAFLAKVGVPPDQVTVDEGSGLSRENRLSAAATTQILLYSFNAPGRQFESLIEALSCAGVDGTLAKRMQWPQTKGRVFAKTGYINGVRTLAGYIHTASGRWLAFAFYYNHAAKTRPLTKLQDRACRLLAEADATTAKPAP